MELTGCDKITADTVYKIVCVWNGGNFPDDWNLPEDWDIKGKRVKW